MPDKADLYKLLREIAEIECVNCTSDALIILRDYFRGRDVSRKMLASAILVILGANVAGCLDAGTDLYSWNQNIQNEYNKQ